MNRKMDMKTLIALIAIGLPGFIMNKIDRNVFEFFTNEKMTFDL